MKLQSLISTVDSLKKNTFTDEVKVSWVNEVEGLIQTDVLRISIDDVVQYTTQDDPTLLVKPPHDRLYRYYLEAMICYEQEEYDRYNNCIDLFNQHLNDYVRWVAETLHPQDELAVFQGYYLSAYTIAVSLGFVGTEEEWIASLKGDKGDPFEYEDFTSEQLQNLTEGIQEYATEQAIAAAEGSVTQAANDAASNAANQVEQQLASYVESAANCAADSASSAQEAARFAQSASNAAQQAADAVRQDLQSIADDAEQSAIQAQDYAHDAELSSNMSLFSANNARDHAENAQSHSNAASTAADQAAQSAAQAAASASAADKAASTAETAAQSASDAAGTASAAASTAEKAAVTAQAAVGKTSYIGDNGNWYEWDAGTNSFVDTGRSASALLDQNGNQIKFWFGTVAEYNQLNEIRSDTYYNILEGTV